MSTRPHHCIILYLFPYRITWLCTCSYIVQVIKRAAQALGYLCVGHPVTEVVDPAVSALLGMQGSKNEDVLFSVGEALCFAFGGAW
jgi:hypothetical protein